MNAPKKKASALDGSSVKVETITPTMAEKYLGHNTHNRSLRQRVVRAYAADMKNGDWRWNGESIKFGQDGTLLDGQHRLAGIVEAGVPVQMLVIRGLPSETQETMDGGAKRKFSDVLALRGEINYTALAAVCRRVVQYQSGSTASGGNYTPTNAQMLQVLDAYPELRDGVAVAGATSRGCAIPHSVLSFAWWLFSGLDAEDAAHFFERLGDGQNMGEGNPIYALRKAAEASRSIRGARSERYLLAITIKAWNAYREGREVSLLRWRPGGAMPERFPEPI